MNHEAETKAGPLSWDALKQYIETRRRPIQDEIRKYPPPIPACDAHFNHLLEQRAMLSRELQRLEAARRDGATVDAFIQTSPCVDDGAVQEMVEGGGIRG